MKTKGFRIITVTIKTAFEGAYEFASCPENFPKWAIGLMASITKTDRGWVAATPHGEGLFCFAPQNEFGVLDYSIQYEGRAEAYVPFRIFPNGGGTQAELMLFKDVEVSDDDFDRETKRVQQDLRYLKNYLESSM